MLFCPDLLFPHHKVLIFFIKLSCCSLCVGRYIIASLRDASSTTNDDDDVVDDARERERERERERDRHPARFATRDDTNHRLATFLRPKTNGSKHPL